MLTVKTPHTQPHSPSLHFLNSMSTSILCVDDDNCASTDKRSGNAAAEDGASNEVNNMNISVLVDAKHEYSRQLIQTLKPHFLSGVLSIYDEAQAMCLEANEEDLCMLTFQELLSQVPKWNRMLVKEETARIEGSSQCDWIDDLLTAVFVCHTKILTTVRITNKSSKKINLQIPTLNDFIHQVYIELAREFWKHPYLISSHDTTKLQYQKNLAVAEGKIAEGIEATVRTLLPIKSILKEYLNNDDDAEEYAPDPASASTPTSDANAGENKPEPEAADAKDPQQPPKDTPDGSASPPLLTPPKEFDDILATLNINDKSGSASDSSNIKPITLAGLAADAPNNNTSTNSTIKLESIPAMPNMLTQVSNIATEAVSNKLDTSAMTDLTTLTLADKKSPSDVSSSILDASDMEQVVVDFGGPRSSSPAPPAVSLDNSVMGQFDALAKGAPPTPAPAPAAATDANKFSFF
jgi:hypothetical protein